MVALRCGAAVRDITPTFPVALHGYGARDQLSLSDAQAHTPLIGARTSPPPLPPCKLGTHDLCAPLPAASLSKVLSIIASTLEGTEG